ncbi:hypothetical protein [Microbacterium sp. WCS2018Hpa-9]|uniref:hypothetical protein n=1 Tax=Microbacterium sp. WCS2018Hpa-9 TaxID=3073635 RepID=UPI002889AF5E|nr:hypothetical protein [Microbacterium sp. WCS2018Hpa-9]
MTSRQLRLLRAATASGAATLVAAASHTTAGGAAPHPLLVVAVATLLVPLAALLIGARLSRARIALTVLVSQGLFHLVFQLLGTPTGATALAGHEHHLDLAALGPVVATATPDALMLVGHVIAAIITTALVCHGESSVRAIAGWVQARLRHTVTVFRPSHERPAFPVFAIRVPNENVFSVSVSRRGPPAHA